VRVAAGDHFAVKRCQRICSFSVEKSNSCWMGLEREFKTYDA
jgi:hypothetical protein